MANTLPIELRREFVPILRSGNFAGPGYAGGWGSESVITHAAINNGQPVQVAELVKTPQGLSQFMSLATQTEPNGYLDAVTRNHDVEYTVAEVRFMNKVQTQFDGRLPYELTAADKSSSAYQTLLGERNQEYWTADQRMLKAAVAYQPTDYADSTYRDLMVKGFYVKTSDGVGGEYNIPQAPLDEFFNTLKAQDPSLGTPSTFGQKLDTLGLANNLARSDFEVLATLPITPQEKAFFNSHLQPGNSIVPSDRNANGEIIFWDQRDFAHSVVVPYVSPTNANIYVAQVKIGDKEITSYLDRTDKDNPVFTQEVRVNSALVSTETRTPVPETSIRTGENTARAYQVELRDGSGEIQKSYTTEKPAVPDLLIDKDLQAKLQAVQTGNYTEVVPEIQTNPHNADAVNGMDFQSDQDHRAQEGSSDTKADDTSDQQVEESDAASDATQQVVDAFSNPQVPTDKGIQVADTSGALPDTFTNTSTPANPNTFTNFLDAQGSTLSPAQQNTLATQLDKLNLGGEGDLSFYSLPNGGALIANSDGDIVGEINRSSTGDLNLKATAISADGSTIEVSGHIQQNGEALTEGQYNAQTQQQASAMFNSLMAANNWDHLSDVGKLSALVNLYNATDKLGESFGASGDNLPGDLGAAAGWFSLAQGIQSGDNLIIANGINIISDGALDSAMNQAFGNTAAGEAVPYLSYALAIRNFADNPEQAMLIEAANDEFFRSAA